MNPTTGAAKTRRDARIWSTTLMLLGLVVTCFLLPHETAEAIYSTAAYGVGLTLVGAFLIEARSGVRSLIRVDLLLFLSLYGLTLLEFLFAQPSVESSVSSVSSTNGTYAVLIAFGGIAIGRHCVPIKEAVRSNSSFYELQPSNVFFVFLVVSFLGYLHILLAVQFDIVDAVRQMLLPRFSQSWSRGQFGDASAMLYEVGALINLVPPIAGLIFARVQNYSVAQKVVVFIVLAFTAFYGFASGTRSVFVTYLVTFSGVYLITKRELSVRQALSFIAIMVTLLFVGIVLMLQFRTVGLGSIATTEEASALFIDMNIVNLSQLTDRFPAVYDYLGLEIPLNALLRPVPRFLWPDKPTGLSVPIEAALGAEGLTLSCTFVGEAYMAGGLLAVLIASVVFGAAAEMWNRVGNSAGQFNQIVYVSGFLCAAIAMRSMLSMVPVMLPTIALWILGKLWLSDRSAPASRSATDKGGR